MIVSRLLKVLIQTTATLYIVRTNGFVSGFSTTRRDVILGSTGGAGLLLSSSTSSNDSVQMPSPLGYPSEEIDPSATIRWGIVGLGDVTQVKSGPPFWKCEGSELVAVMRRTPGKASEFARRVPNKSTQNNNACVGYEDLDEFLKHPGLEAVYVATRPGTHAEIATRVAEAGLACYVEKPVGRCAIETKELTEVFESRGLPLYTAYISRAYERTQAVRQLMRDGVLGDKLVKVGYSLRGTGGARDMATKDLPWRLDPGQSGGGLIMDVGCHVLDRIDYLCGPLEQAKGTAEHRGSTGANNDDGIPVVENYCHATAVVGSSAMASIPDGGCEGATVDLTWDFSSTDEKDAVDELRFSGSNGRTLTMAGMSPNGPIDVIDKDGSTVLRSLNFDTPEHTAQRLIQAVTNNLLDRKTMTTQEADSKRADFLSFGENAIRTQIVIDTMLESYYGGREIGYWSRSDSWPGSPKGKS
mmetsp:Transcript_29712/g.63639  ORF Transcript_29712/g.63639 Transcript_29712/m.63639 type:complete len:470 (-) Transcript_29712:186-1595(-)